MEKLTFKQFLLLENGRLEYFVKTFGSKLIDAAAKDVSARNIHDPYEILERLKAMDPTQGKSLMFLVPKYIAGQFRLEDATRVTAALERFYKIRSTLPNKDLNQFKTIHDLYDVVEQQPAEQQAISGKQQKKIIKQEGAEKIIEAPNFMVLRLISGEAACYYAAGTKWCTSDPEVFKSYAKNGDIYVIIVKDQQGRTRKFQYHYESGQVMDERDAPISKADIKLLSSFPEWYQFVDMQVQRHYKELK